MKPEAQRIAIAEACGLFRIMPLRRTTRRGRPDENGVRLWYCSEHHGGAGTYEELPDYLNDLNAMHEAEQVLIGRNDWELCDYVHRLHKATNGWPALATAAQRAEAFLRTLNLWEP